MSDIFNIKIEQNDIGLRIDSVIFAKMESISRSAIQKLIADSQVTVNGKTITKNYKMRCNDLIEVVIKKPVDIDIIPQEIPVDIIFEDNNILVVNKPKGMVVHPSIGNYDKTLVNALMFHCKDSLSGINGRLRPGIVHRIDKNTSGLLIVAKNDIAHQSLAKQISEHSFLREYEAVVYGNVKKDYGTVDYPIGRNKIDRKKMCVTFENAKEAVTHYEVLERFNGFTHIKCKLETGRTHQIRVHMAYIGHSIAGDDIYGVKKYIKSLNGQCLHAKKIGFVHPITNDYIEFDSDLPKYFQSFINGLKNKV